MISGMPSVVSLDKNINCNIIVENCAPFVITLEHDDLIGLREIEEEELFSLRDDIILSVCQDIHHKFPKIKKKRLSRQDIAQKFHVQFPKEFEEQYINISFKHQDAISIDKYDLGLAKNFTHKMYLKTKDLVYRNNTKSQRQITNFLNKH